MTVPVNIVQQLRLFLTAITLLLVVGLNNREVTTYTVPDAAAHQVAHAPAAEQHGIVKKKVSLEATSSYLVLQLAALPANFPRLNFPDRLIPVKTSYSPVVAVSGFYKLFFSTAIQPNAP